MLTHIDLSYNALGDQGAKALSDIWKCDMTSSPRRVGIKWVELDNNGIGYEGCVALANGLIRHCSTLTTLSFKVLCVCVRVGGQRGVSVLFGMWVNVGWCVYGMDDIYAVLV